MSDQPPPLRDLAPLAPLNALPLDYVPPSIGRPGIVTAIGVISIVVAVLSGLSSVGSGFTVFGFWMMSQIPMPMARPAPVLRTPASPSAPNQAALAVGPRGFELPQRRAAISGLRQAHPIDEKRVKMLDALLADSGQDLFTFGGDSIAAASVAASVSDSGQVHKLSGEPGPDFFILGGGRLELYDDHAVFMPSDGRDTIRVSEDEIAIEGNVLTPADVQTALSQAQFLCGNKLSAAQIGSLRSQLEGPSQWLIDKSKRIPVASQFSNVRVQPNGTATIQSINGFLMMDANGAVTYSMSSTGFMAGAGGGSPFKVSGGAALIVIVVSVLSAGLAIYLLVIGILTLRQSLRGRQLHLIYAAIKIPLSILAVVGVYWMATSFMTSFATSMPGAAPAGSARTGLGMFYGALSGLGLIYPIALIIALSTRRMREYYSGVMRG